MPNISFEYTANLELENIEPVVVSMHKILEAELPTKIDNCKTLISKCNDFLVGDADKDAGFIRVVIKIMPGRDEKLLKEVSMKVVKLLQGAFSEMFANFNLHIAVSIVDLPSNYTKVSNDDL